MTQFHDNHALAVKSIINKVGKTIVMGVPLGIGKPVGFLNALYQAALADTSIQLTIVTALTLARPQYQSDLEKRFVEPLLNRLLGNYEDPLYEIARVNQQLPANINVIEFFLSTGKYLHNDYVQQHYINTTYTLAARDALNLGLNVIAQQVSPSATNKNLYSLSSNSDLFQEIFIGLPKDKPTAIIAEINANLPYMLGEAEIENTIFTDVIDTKQYPDLFAIPHDELSNQDHLIGLYTSFLIKDDSCLQIGIGKLSNAVASAVIFRQKNNALYQNIVKQISDNKFNHLISTMGGLGAFEQGIYASTEMLSDGCMQLYDAGILRKRVYDHVGLQKLLNEKKITEKITPDYLTILVDNHIISKNLTPDDMSFLQKFGIVKTDGSINIGSKLQLGKIIHAGFFLGTNQLYQQLRDLSPEQLSTIDMTSISRTNSMLDSIALFRLQRQHARFVNTTMMVTLGGAAISDGLQNMQEVSGIGGQFDFIDMAQCLEGARSILNCHSTRKSAHGVSSNIIWDYSNLTIPRFYRDIIVTEYGIADCRSKTDADVIKAMLNIADSRFQPMLLAAAKRAGKIEKNYQIPVIYRDNYPEKVHAIISALQRQGYCQPYPFGTELTAEEQVLKAALLKLKNLSSWGKLWLLCKAMVSMRSDKDFYPYLERMKLANPKTLQALIYKKLLKMVI